MILEIVFIILLFLGIALTAIPTLPGLAYMFLVVLIYGIIDKFETIEPWHMAVFGGMVLLGVVIDYASGLIGAKFGGANKQSILFGLGGLIIGLVLFPPFGLFIGLFLGILIGELVQMKEYQQALKAASYSFLGVAGGMVLSTLLAIAFFITFIVILF